MTLTTKFRETGVQRVPGNSSFERALLDVAATLFLDGEPETSRRMLRDPVTPTSVSSNSQ